MLAQSYSDAYVTDWLVTRDNPYDGRETYRNIQAAYNKMARVVRAGNYDACWIVEADMLPPPDALAKLYATLVSTGAEIVTGVYVLRHGSNVPNLFVYQRGMPSIGSGMPWDELRRVQTSVLQVDGGCMGCVLVKPSALDFDFEGVSTTHKGAARAPDVDWMQHNHAAGRVTLARLDVRCGHIEIDGTILQVKDFLS